MLKIMEFHKTENVYIYSLLKEDLDNGKFKFPEPFDNGSEIQKFIGR